MQSLCRQKKEVIKLLELDNTARTCFDACEQKYYLRHILDLVPLEPPSMAPFLGIAIHKGVQAFYEKRERDEVMRAFGEEYAKWFDEKDDERTPANGMIILDSYMKRWEEDYLETIEKNGKLLLEIGHSIIVEGRGIEVVYKMRIDRVAEWNEEVVLVDWKTSKYVGSSFTLIRPNNQFVGYALGVKELIGVNPIFFLDMIGTHVKKRVKEGEERVELVRESVKFTEEEFEEFRRGVIETAKRIEKCRSENYWAKRTHSCPSFSGCEYLPLCKADKETWEGMVKTFYKKEKWRAYE